MNGLSRRALLAMLAALPLAACARKPRVVHQRFVTFGTEIAVSIYDAEPALAATAIGELQELYAILNEDWYAWGSGELGRLNDTLASATEAPISASLATLLERSAGLAALSGGRFDPAVGNLVRLWQFDRYDSGPPLSALPEPATLAASLTISRSGFTLSQSDDGHRLRAGAAGLAIDLGAIAKGAALELGIDALESAGIGRALIDAGGDLMALSASDPSPFRIGLRDPRDASAPRPLILMPGEAVMSSGDYARFWELDGQRYQHIIDPRDGQPVSAARAATVISTDPLLADAAATALIVGGRTDFDALCDAMGVDKALLVDNLGQELITPTMRARLET